MQFVFNEQVAEAAVRLALPTIQAMVEMVPNMVWGPKGAVIGIKGPGMEHPHLTMMAELYENPGEWEGCTAETFKNIVLGKLGTVERTGQPTEQVLNDNPAALCSEDTIYSGGEVLGSLECATSGFTGWGDAATARIVLQCAQFICRAIKEVMQASGQAFVGYVLNQTRYEVLRPFAA